MQKVDGIGGVFIRGRDTKALSAWYETHLGISSNPGEWQPDGGVTVFAPFAEDDTYFPSENRWMLNFRVSDLDAMRAQLEAAGVEVLTDPAWDMPDVGRFARVHDPEGNPIELWEPSKEVRDH